MAPGSPRKASGVFRCLDDEKPSVPTPPAVPKTKSGRRAPPAIETGNAVPESKNKSPPNAEFKPRLSLSDRSNSSPHKKSMTPHGSSMLRRLEKMQNMQSESEGADSVAAVRQRMVAEMEAKAQAAANRDLNLAADSMSENSTPTAKDASAQEASANKLAATRLSDEEAINRARRHLQSYMDVNRMLHGAIIKKQIRSDEIERELAKLEEKLWLGRDVLEMARQDCIDESEEMQQAEQQKLQASNLELGNIIIEEEERMAAMEAKHASLKELGIQYRSILKEQEAEISARRKAIKQLHRHVEIIAEGGGNQAITPALSVSVADDDFGLPIDAITEEELAKEQEAKELDKQLADAIKLPSIALRSTFGPAPAATSPRTNSGYRSPSVGSPGSSAGSPSRNRPASTGKKTEDDEEKHRRYQELPGLDLQKMLFRRDGSQGSLVGATTRPASKPMSACSSTKELVLQEASPRAP